MDNSPAASKSELVSQAAPPTNEKEVGHVAGPISLLSISQIEANPYQPRKDFNNDALIELATSIGELGLIQPITVRKVSSQKYQIISGERRFRASQMANLTEVPVYIRETDDQGMLEMALVENIQRENLNALEIAISYKRLMEECNLTTDKLADRVGKDRTTVTNYVRLLRLPPEIQLGIIEKRISMGHARALINAEPESKQIKIFKLILEKDLSVRKVEELVKEDDAPKLFASKANLMPLEIQKMQADLKLRFGKKAKVTRNDGGVGKVEIPFTNDDDLERIIAMLGLNA